MTSIRVKYKHGIKNRVMKVAITKPTPREIAIGAKYAASPLVSNIKVSSPPNVVNVVKITALNLFFADI